MGRRTQFEETLQGRRMPSKRRRLVLGLPAALVLVSLAVAAPALAATPTVESIKPTSGLTSGGTTVTIIGSGLTGATAVDFGASPAAFTVHSSRKITAVAPPGAGTVDVTVTTPEGTSATGPSDAFTYLPTTPSIERLTPDHGRAPGGSKVTISGVNLGGATSVEFGEVPSPSVTVKSSKSLVAVSPRGLGTVDVTVTTPEGTSPLTPADRYTYEAKPPVVEVVSPNKGPAAGGTTVGIGGSELYGVTSVMFGETPAASFVDNPNGSVTAVAPAETVARVNVLVSTPYGTSLPERCVFRAFEEEAECVTTDHFKFLDPTITSVAPENGPASGGTPVTLTGSGFAPGEAETVIMFGKSPATSVDCSSITTCTAVSPAHKAGSEKVIVIVNSNEPQRSKSASDGHFRYE